MSQECQKQGYSESAKSNQPSDLEWFQKTDFNLVDVLSDVGNLCVIATGQNGLELFFSVSPDMPQRFRGDPVRLRYVLSQVVNHFVQCSQTMEVVIKASIGSIEKVTQGVFAQIEIVICSKDVKRQGSLFPDVEIEQADGFSANYQDLTASFRYLAMMGGAFKSNCHPKRGSQIQVSIPLEVLEPAKAFIFPSLQNCRVFAAVKSEVFARQLEIMLRRVGMRANVVTDVERAIAMLDEAEQGADPYHFVLLDAAMGAQGGFRLAEYLKNLRLELNRVVMLLPFQTLSTGLIRCYQEGLAFCLTKPFSANELYRVLLQVQCGDQVRRIADSEQGWMDTLWEQAEAGSSFCVLLAESDPVSRMEIAGLLEKTGYRVILAENGQKAIDACATQHFDVVLMSLDLPVVNGFDAAQTIFEQEHCYRTQTGAERTPTPIVALVDSNRNQKEQYRFDEIGIVAHVEKPVRPELLLNVLQRIEKLQDGLSAQEEEVADALELETDLIPFRVRTLINLEEAEEMFGGNKEVVGQLIDVFFENIESTLQGLEAAHAENNLERLAQLAHTIKGSIGVFGAERVVEAAKALEMVSRASENQIVVSILLRRLQEEIEALCNILRAKRHAYCGSVK